jgi:hypothetical protein
MNINDYLSTTTDDLSLISEYVEFRNLFNELNCCDIDLTVISENTELIKNQLNKLQEEIHEFKKKIHNKGFVISENKFFEHIYTKFSIIEDQIPFNYGDNI